MKNLILFLSFTLLAVVGCQNPSEQKTETATDTPPNVSANDTVQTPIAGGSTFTCYEFTTKGKDKYSCQIETRATLNPFVSGYYNWAPYEKDGAHGILKNGIIENGFLTADYIYMIEGNVQSEEVYFKIDSDKLTKMSGELVEKDGKLVAKDKNKMQQEIVMPKVECTNLQGIIEDIKSFEKDLVIPK